MAAAGVSGKRSTRGTGRRGDGKGGTNAGMSLPMAALEEVDELSFVPPERQRQRVDRAKAKIRDVFRLFERDNSLTCDVREIGTMVRALGLNPTEEQLHHMLEEMEEDVPVGYVKYDRFEHLMVQVLLTSEFRGDLLVRDSEELVVHAFEALDKEGKGYIDADALKEMLVTQGEKFTTEEINEFINAAADPETGHIRYDDYAAMLATD